MSCACNRPGMCVQGSNRYNAPPNTRIACSNCNACAYANMHASKFHCLNCGSVFGFLIGNKTQTPAPPPSQPVPQPVGGTGHVPPKPEPGPYEPRSYHSPKIADDTRAIAHHMRRLGLKGDAGGKQ